MKTRSSSLIKVFIAAAMGIVFIASLTPTTAQDSDDLTTVELPFVTLDVGDTATLDADIACAVPDGCSAFDITLRYDPTVIRVDALAVGPYLGDLIFIAQNEIDNDMGEIRLAVAVMGIMPEPDSMNLFSVDVTALAAGDSRLIVTHLDVADAVGNPVAAEGIDGGVIVNAPEPSTPTSEADAAVMFGDFRPPEDWPEPERRGSNTLYLTNGQAEISVYQGDAAYFERSWGIPATETHVLAAGHIVAESVAGDIMTGLDEAQVVPIEIFAENGRDMIYIMQLDSGEWVIVTARASFDSFDTYRQEVFDPLVESFGVPLPADYASEAVAAAPIETPRPTPTPDPTATPEPEPCTVSTSEPYVDVRVGPGENRGVRSSLPQNQAILVVGQAEDDSGNLWWKIQPPGYNPSEADRYWVAADNVRESGDCDQVADADASTLISSGPSSGSSGATVRIGSRVDVGGMTCLTGDLTEIGPFSSGTIATISRTQQNRDGQTVYCTAQFSICAITPCATAEVWASRIVG